MRGDDLGVFEDLTTQLVLEWLVVIGIPRHYCVDCHVYIGAFSSQTLVMDFVMTKYRYVRTNMI